MAARSFVSPTGYFLKEVKLRVQKGKILIVLAKRFEGPKFLFINVWDFEGQGSPRQG
jgi:hypothetical protein